MINNVLKVATRIMTTHSIARATVLIGSNAIGIIAGEGFCESIHVEGGELFVISKDGYVNQYPQYARIEWKPIDEADNKQYQSSREFYADNPSAHVVIESESDEPTGAIIKDSFHEDTGHPLDKIFVIPKGSEMINLSFDYKPIDVGPGKCEHFKSGEFMFKEKA